MLKMSLKRKTTMLRLITVAFGFILVRFVIKIHLDGFDRNEIDETKTNGHIEHRRREHTRGRTNNAYFNKVTLNSFDSINLTIDCNKYFKKSHFMEVVLDDGRIGNRLFQLFALLALTKQYCYTPLLINFKKQLGDMLYLNYEEISMSSSTEELEWKVFGHTNSRMFDPDVFHLDTTFNWKLKGYLQSWRYFVHEEEYLRSVVQFKPTLLRTAGDFIRNLSAEDDLNICVHVRRGDFLTDYYSKRGWCVANRRYLEHAMEYFTTKYKNENINYIFISDDIDWCKNNTVGGKRIYFSPFASDPSGPAKDLAMLSLCDHCIITAGTFGWMGAWLSGGNVVYFDGFPRPGSWLDIERNRTFYYPPHWIGLH